MRVYLKPFVDWIWGGCVPDGARRLPRRCPIAAIASRVRRAARRAGRRRGGASDRIVDEQAALVASARRSSSCCSRFLWVGLSRDPREVPSPLIGKPAPAFTLAQLHEPAKTLGTADLQGQGVAAQRLGVVVRVLPRRASAAGRSSRKANVVPIVGLNYKDKPDDGTRVARAARQSVHGVGRRPRRPRRHRLRRLRRAGDVRDRQDTASIRYKQIGPLTVEALQQKILPLVRELQKSMSARIVAHVCWRSRMIVAGAALAADALPTAPAIRRSTRG